MEKFNVDYSDKAIGPYHITAFKKDLMGRLQQVIVRMEWKLELEDGRVTWDGVVPLSPQGRLYSLG